MCAHKHVTDLSGWDFQEAPQPNIQFSPLVSKNAHMIKIHIYIEMYNFPRNVHNPAVVLFMQSIKQDIKNGKWPTFF